MRHLSAICVTFAALGCSAGSGGTQSSTAGASASGTGSSSTGSAASQTSRANSASTSTTRGGTSSSSCGADSCGPCPHGYVSADECQNGSWQCDCGAASSSTLSGSGGGSTFNGSGGGSGSGGSASSSSSSGSSGTVGCSVAGALPTLAGSWSGTTTFAENIASTTANGGGADMETVVSNFGGIEFQTFMAQELVGCALPFTFNLSGATSASVVTGSTCVDISQATWTFEAGTATLDATGCVMTVTTSGTVVDPSLGEGTFTTSSMLTLQ